MVIIYKSNSGYTKEYAKLLSDMLDIPAYSMAEAPDCQKGKDAIYLGWLMAGSIVGYKQALKKYRVRAVCGVGMSPPSGDMVLGFRTKYSIPDTIKVYYLQGGFDINRLKGPFKLIMKVKVKEIAGRLRAKPELSPAEQATYDMTQGAASCVCKENLAEIVADFKK